MTITGHTPPPPAPPSNLPPPSPPDGWQVNADGSIGPGKITTLDTPAALEAELRAAFESAEFKNTTSAAFDGFFDPRTDPSVAAQAMAAAVGAPVLPQPTVQPGDAPAFPASPAPSAAPSTTPSEQTAPESTPGQFVPPAGAPGAAPDAPAGTPAPGSIPGEAGDQAAGDQSLPPPSGYDLIVPNPQTGQLETRRLTEQEIRSAVGLREWADSLPDSTKAAFAAIDTGQAVPIPRAEYDQYIAWKSAQTDRRVGNLGTAPPSAQIPQIDYSELDPQTAAAVQATMQQNALLQQQLQQRQQYEAQQAAAQASQQFDAQAVAKSRAYEQAALQYGQARGLTQAELESVAAAAVEAQIVPHLERKHTTYNSLTGQVLAPADAWTVVSEALDYALWQNPALYQSVAARQHAQQTAPGGAPTTNPSQPFQGFPGTQQPAPVPTANGNGALTGADPIIAKKAQAASLATAPAANVTLPPRDVRTFTREETAEAMAGDIARYWAGQ